MPLKDVLVSDPAMLDAVVQSSDRVFLIAKKTGQTNAFFFDEYGQQILTLEVAVGADLSALDELLTRLIPGSNVHSEIAGKAIVLTGTVRTPIDSNRAAQIAAQFAAANSGCQQHRHGTEPHIEHDQHDHHQHRPRLELSGQQTIPTPVQAPATRPTSTPRSQ